MSDSTAFINFPDRPRELKFTLSAVRHFRAKTGIPLWKARLVDPEDGISRILDSEIMTSVVWAGLLHVDPKITFDKVEKLLEDFLKANPGELKSIYNAVAAAFQESGLFGLNVDKDDESESKDSKDSDPSSTPNA